MINTEKAINLFVIFRCLYNVSSLPITINLSQYIWNTLKDQLTKLLDTIVSKIFTFIHGQMWK